MKLQRQLVAYAIAVGLLFAASGCAKKRPQLPTQATAPAEPIPSNLPPEISEETPPPPPQPAPTPEAPPPEEPKPKPVQHHKHKSTQPAVTAQNSNPSSASAANNSNTTIAAAHPPTNPAAETPPDTAIAADVSSAQLSQQKQTTAQLIDDTQKTINGLNRSLSHDEQEIVVQIRSYVSQSLDATKEGDFERAYNLATKAHLLSAALVKK